MTDLLEEIFLRIDTYREQVISIQKELTSRIALGPDNGGTGEHDKVAYIRQLFENLRPDLIEEIKAPDEGAQNGYRPNLIAIWEGEKALSRLWILSHSDVVPPGDLSLWTTNPYELRVEGDKIFGRGVEDNHHGIISSLLAVKAILETGKKPYRPIALAVVADEETGSKYGLNFLLSNRRELFDEQDLIVVPDGGNETGTMIEVAEKSMLWIRFTILGNQCHASTPHKGKNALTATARLIVALERLKQEFHDKDELFSPPISTFEPTKIEPNVANVNTIPGKGIFYMDCRILPRHQVDMVLNKSKEIASEISKDLGVRILVEPALREDAAPPTPVDAPVVRALTKAIHTVTGREAKPMGIGGGTVAAFFRKAGLPAAVWCTCPGTAHQPDEYCIISHLINDAKVFAAMAFEELR